MTNSTYQIVQNFVSSLFAANDAREFNQTDKRMRTFAQSCPAQTRRELIRYSDALRSFRVFILVQLVPKGAPPSKIHQGRQRCRPFLCPRRDTSRPNTVKMVAEDGICSTDLVCQRLRG